MPPCFSVLEGAPAFTRAFASERDSILPKDCWGSQARAFGADFFQSFHSLENLSRNPIPRSSDTRALIGKGSRFGVESGKEGMPRG